MTRKTTTPLLSAENVTFLVRMERPHQIKKQSQRRREAHGQNESAKEVEEIKIKEKNKRGA
jgi:hypothetical protein